MAKPKTCDDSKAVCLCVIPDESNLDWGYSPLHTFLGPCSNDDCITVSR